jgi:glycosyltransferase involved in cell wall biosynthesis
MGCHSMKILQVSTSDIAGGAERSASNLARMYRELGHQSWLAVGHKRTADPDVLEIPNDASRNALVRTIDDVLINHDASVRRVRGLGRAARGLRRVAEPSRFVDVERGREDFHYPGTQKLLELPPERPDILHLHNLHGFYFDLEALTTLSAMVPTVLNVRDGWLMSGHCAFGLGCERWKTGCGECPDLTIFPAIKRDATAFNWARKRAILAKSRLYVTTPSQWMMDRVNESIIAASAIGQRVIPNGVDTATFKPGNRNDARRALGIESDARVLLLAANGLGSNMWKDYDTLLGALRIIGKRSWSPRLIVVALGEPALIEQIGSLELRFLPFESDSARLADYYRAADLYLHAARVESFGNVLLEARACGTAVVATAVGGIPEQIRGTDTHGDAATGVLVEPGNPAAFAEATIRMLLDDNLRETIAANGQRQVFEEFTLEKQSKRFLSWYEEILRG